MKSARKLCCVLCMIMLSMTGCGVNSTSQSAATQAATQSSTNTTQSKSSPVISSTTVNNSVSVKLPINSNKTGKPIKASGIFLYNSNLYYKNPINNEITCINKNTAVQYSNKSMVTTSNIGKLQFINEFVSEMLFSNNTIYYTNMADNNNIYSIDLNGQNKKKLVNESAHSMILMGIYIYYLNNDDNLKVFDSGSGTTYSLQINAICFDSDGTNIYYDALNSDGSYSLNSVNIDGSGVQILNNDSTSSIAVNNGKVFYVNGSDGQTLYYSTTNGKTRARFSDIQVESLQYAGGYIYYTGDFGNLYKIRIDGSLNTEVITDPFLSSFIFDNGTIYFTRDIDTEDAVFKTAG